MGGGGRGWEPIETTARLARVFSNLFPLRIEGRQRLLPPQFLIVNKITSSLHTRIFSDPSKNLRNTVHSSLCGFFDAHSQRKTYEVPTRYRADTGKDPVKSSQIFLFSRIVAVGPIRYRLRLHTVPTAIVMILLRTFPLSANPGEVFFIISILKRTSRYRRR